MQVFLCCCCKRKSGIVQTEFWSGRKAETSLTTFLSEKRSWDRRQENTSHSDRRDVGGFIDLNSKVIIKECKEMETMKRSGHSAWEPFSCCESFIRTTSKQNNQKLHVSHKDNLSELERNVAGSKSFQQKWKIQVYGRDNVKERWIKYGCLKN